MFHDMIHKEVEIYTDNMMVKSKQKKSHLATLEKFLQKLKSTV